MNRGIRPQRYRLLKYILPFVQNQHILLNRFVRRRIALDRDNEAAGGPALRMGPLQKMNVRANELARRFNLLSDPPPR